ncbi:MAG TPA: hypothetical protein VJB87_05480 [Candidatus Nanoarchaeia archaeon]|nr:hypothetical protein [Candidatus Nanoarchaeia archaeon]
MAKHRIENATKKTDVKLKKKIWIALQAPAIFNNMEVGETICERPEQLVGRNMAINLMTLTNDPKKQNVDVHLKIKSISEGKANTELVGYELSGAYVKKIIRRSGGKIEDSFPVTTKDNITFQIKPLLMTKSKTYKSTLNSMRLQVREHITQDFKNMDAQTAFLAVIQNKLQKETRESVKKIYPASVCEIRRLELLHH